MPIKMVQQEVIKLSFKVCALSVDRNMGKVMSLKLRMTLNWKENTVGLIAILRQQTCRSIGTWLLNPTRTDLFWKHDEIMTKSSLERLVWNPDKPLAATLVLEA